MYYNITCNDKWNNAVYIEFGKLFMTKLQYIIEIFW